MKIAHKKQPQR